MTINLVHEAMTSAIGRTRSAHERLVTDRRRAERRVDAFLASGWEGVAASAFEAAWRDWVTAAGQVADGLDSMADLLVAHHQDMARQDESTQEALDALSARIIDRLG